MIRVARAVADVVAGFGVAAVGVWLAAPYGPWPW